MLKNTDKIRKRYNRASIIYDLMEKPMEMMGLKRWREEIMKELPAKFLRLELVQERTYSFIQKVLK